MLRFNGEMKHVSVRLGNGMRSEMSVPTRVDARKGGRRKKERKETKREATGEERTCERNVRKGDKERRNETKKSPLLAGAGMGK